MRFSLKTSHLKLVGTPCTTGMPIFSLLFSFWLIMITHSIGDHLTYLVPRLCQGVLLEAPGGDDVRETPLISKGLRQEQRQQLLRLSRLGRRV